MDKWIELRNWLEKEVNQKYEKANEKNGQDQLLASSFAMGMDEVLVKMQLIEKESSLLK